MAKRRIAMLAKQYTERVSMAIQRYVDQEIVRQVAMKVEQQLELRRKRRPYGRFRDEPLIRCDKCTNLVFVSEVGAHARDCGLRPGFSVPVTPPGDDE